MYVVKRSGERELVSFDKVLDRIRRAAAGLSVNPTRLAQLVLGNIYNGVQTQELDEEAAKLAISFTTLHPDWGTLAAQIIVSNCQRSALPTFSATMSMLMRNCTDKGVASPVLSEDVGAFIAANAKELDVMILPSNDFLLDYFGFKTLERSYLQRSSSTGRVMETPQYMWLRVAVGIWGSGSGSEPDLATRLSNISATYNLMSTKAFTHATPTLFNSGTKSPQLSSCFLLGVEDSLHGMYSRLTDCAMISKYAGGVGLHISDIRATGSHIAGTNGKSDGIIPFLKVYSDASHHVNQSGRRNGSFAVYLEPWHADMEDFLKLKLGSGSEEARARNLFYALWIPDLFMRRVEANETWSLFCPHEAPGLTNAVGAEFDALYARFEATPGLARKVIPAQTLWKEILASQVETGTPYLLYKDAANLKSNQKNLGTIKSSNLCTEIIEYSDEKEVAVCNLASLSLPYCLDACGCRPTADGRPQHHRFGEHSHAACPLFDDGFPDGADPTRPPRFELFNFERLRATVATVVRNLNRVIDINAYPVPEARASNMRNRPIGIGVQGLADVFARMGLPWESPAAATLNREIFENIYYAAVDESVKMAVEYGAYEMFKGSPASQGLLQPDLWGVKPELSAESRDYLDWVGLRERVVRDGLRNSLLVAVMPTASTSQILGNNECIEPYTTNMYVRRTSAGEYTVINKHLVADLLAAGIWSPEFKERLVAANGSIQDGFPEVSDACKKLYKTVWEIPQRTLIDMSADRGAYICQSQSLNLYVSDPTIARLTSMHFHAWKRGLKTGMYYLRVKPRVNAIKFTVDPSVAAAAAVATAGTATAGTATVDRSTSATSDPQPQSQSQSQPQECLMCSA